MNFPQIESVGPRISFLADLELTRHPGFPRVEYKRYTSVMNEFNVQVLDQHPETGLLTLQVLTPGVTMNSLQYMSAELFQAMFKPLPVIDTSDAYLMGV